jgi:hypothetical protein
VCSLISFILFIKIKINMVSTEQTSEQTSEPTVLTLDNTNSIQILSQYIELAQQKGAFLLNEAELLKRAMDVLVNNVPDHEINKQTSMQLLIQGVNKGQRHGSYTLNDASLLSKVVQYVSSSYQQPSSESKPQETQTESSSSKEVVQEELESDDDLADLATPIPLKPKEV